MQPLLGGALPVPIQAAESDGGKSARAPKGARFRRQHRLVKHEVESLLRGGARLGRAEVFIKLGENTVGYGRIAIAVPKRILKRAVDRNRVKRIIREEFRENRIRVLPVDMLVTLHGRIARQGGKRGIPRQEWQKKAQTVSQLFGDIAARFAPSIRVHL